MFQYIFSMRKNSILVQLEFFAYSTQNKNRKQFLIAGEIWMFVDYQMTFQMVFSHMILCNKQKLHAL